MYKSILFAILLLVTAVSIGGQNIQDSYLAEARGDYANALLQMQNLLKEDPQDLFYIMRSAWLQYLLGNYNTAQTLYQAALKQQEHLDAQLGIINCHLALAEWDAVISYSESLLNDNPQNTTLLSKAAYACYMKKSYLAAASYFARIKEISPWDMSNRGYLVNNLYLSGDIPRAKEEYRQLKKYYPQSQIIVDYRETLDTQ
jgi:tetratricopeptide (TPR) repeat protein